MANITRAPRRPALLLFVLIASLAPLAPLHAQSVPALKLIPMPRELQAGSILPLDHGVLIRTVSRDAEDRFTAEDLRATLKERAVPSRATGPVIELLRTNAPSARALLAAAHITFEPPMHDEGYVIVPRRRGLAVIAATSAGLFYGAQTV
jgi:hypothetical protein